MANKGTAFAGSLQKLRELGFTPVQYSSGGGGTGAFGSGGSSGGGGFRGGVDPSKTFSFSIDEPYPDDTQDKNSTASYSGGYAVGGVSGPQQIDLQGLLNSLTSSGASQKETVKSSYGNQRQNLLDSLKRYQEETAESKRQQRDSFNANRADLEAQAYMANRAALQNAAARGLGGSGLQQLAQLQNQIQSGEETSKLAKANQTALDALTRALANKEEDVTKGVNQLTQEEANKVNEIESNIEQAKQQLQYNEAVRFQEALERAAATNASIAASAANADREAALTENMFNNALSGIISNANNTFDSITKSKDLTEAYNTMMSNLNEAAGQTYLPAATINAYRSELTNNYQDRLAALTGQEQANRDSAYNNFWRFFNPIEDLNKIF